MFSHRSQSSAVSRVRDPGHTLADGSHPSGQDSEEGVALGNLQTLLSASDSSGLASLRHLLPQ